MHVPLSELIKQMPGYLSHIEFELKDAIQYYAENTQENAFAIYKLYNIVNTPVMHKSLQEIIILFFDSTENSNISKLHSIYKNIISEESFSLSYYREIILVLTKVKANILQDVGNYLFSYEYQHYTVVMAESLILLAKIKHNSTSAIKVNDIETLIHNLTSSFYYSFTDDKVKVEQAISKEDINSILINNLKIATDRL